MTAAVLDENLALTATLTGGTWVRPLENLLDPTVKETTARCVSGNPEDAWFDVVFPEDERVDTVLIAGGTIRPEADFRLTWYDDHVARAPENVLLGGPDSEWLPVYRLADPEDQDWHEDEAWTGRPSPRELAGKTPMLITRPPVSPRCAALRIEIDNKGYLLDLGHLFLARAFMPDWGHNWGMALRSMNASPVDTTRGGRRLPDERPAPRQKEVEFDSLTENEAMRMHDLGPRLGKSGLLAMIENIDELDQLWRRTWLATLVDGDVPVTQGEENWWRAALKLLEVIG